MTAINGHTSRWTPELIQELRTLWNVGHSARIIAQRLGNGLSRNAVIGKAHRLKLPQRQKHMRNRHAVVRKPVKRNPKVSGGIASNLKKRVGKLFAVNKPIPQRILEPPKPPTCEPVTLMARTARQCCWPISDTAGPDTLMCGAPKEIEHSYCEWHREVAKGKSLPAWTPERRARYMRTLRRGASANDNRVYDEVRFDG